MPEIERWTLVDDACCVVDDGGRGAEVALVVDHRWRCRGSCWRSPKTGNLAESPPLMRRVVEPEAQQNAADNEDRDKFLSAPWVLLGRARRTEEALSMQPRLDRLAAQAHRASALEMLARSRLPALRWPGGGRAPRAGGLALKMN